ncbi:hypothetical protein FACS1894153_0030 [Bacteroidia bacterium]|nr:hypothetical protein FACS1894153_0030 [Bacteroidia bacterium]
MKQIILKLMFLLAFALVLTTANASNVTITTKPVLSAPDVAGIRTVSFEIRWDFSWHSLEPNNWDAVWIFAKYRLGSDEWDHLYMYDDSDPSVTNEVTALGSVPMTYKFGKTDDGSSTVGFFLYRKNPGRGSIPPTTVSFQWKPNGTAFEKYKQRDDILPTDDITVKVFAIEMVYVPTGAFYLGSGGTENAHFRSTIADVPYKVLSEDWLVLDTLNAPDNNLTCANTAGVSYKNFGVANSIGPRDTLSDDYPKGFKAFYCMKYEISQGAYVDFLNTLTAVQQQARLTQAGAQVNLNAAPGTRVFYMTNTSDKNGIEIVKPGIAEFGCDLNNNNNPNEADDGVNVACAMRCYDLMAYLDFSGLRPMSEMEYEKACRGTLDPVPNEYAWGSTFATTNNAIKAGTLNTAFERPNLDYVNWLGTGQALLIRNGGFATDSSTRISSGATYYGIMEMGNNLYELTVNVNSAQGRSFRKAHGDGRITASGAMDVMYWPNDYTGFGLRGGNIGAGLDASYSVSSRINAYWASSGNNAYNVGGRGVRTE